MFRSRQELLVDVAKMKHGSFSYDPVFVEYAT